MLDHILNILIINYLIVYFINQIKINIMNHILYHLKIYHNKETILYLNNN